MPELPDITVYIEQLERRIVGQTLEKLEIAKPFVLRTFDPPVAEVVGKTVRGVRRMGKRIVLVLDDELFDGELFIVIHLMIAGRLRWRAPEAKLPPKGSILARLVFASGVLVLTEAGTTRRASIHLVRGEDALRQFDRGGLEVLSATLADFAARLRSENHTLKRALADPRLFSGIGNAYSDEILHRARLSPVMLTRRIRDEEIARLFGATKSTLEEWTARLRADVGDSFPEKVTAFREENGGAWPIRRAVSRVRGARAADPVCEQRDELLRALSDGREAARGPRALTAVGKGLAQVDRRHRVNAAHSRGSVFAALSEIASPMPNTWTASPVSHVSSGAKCGFVCIASSGSTIQFMQK